MSWIDDLRRRRIPGMSRACRTVLVAIAENADYRTGVSKAKQATIASLTGYSEGHVRRAVAALAADGWIAVERHDRRFGNRYTIDTARVADAAGRLFEVVPERALCAPGPRTDARSERAPTRAPKVTPTVTSPSPVALPTVVEQLVLALLVVTAGGGIPTRTERADARTAAVELAASGLTSEDVPRLVAGARALGWSDGALTAGSIRRNCGKLLTAGARYRPAARNPAQPDCTTCAAHAPGWVPDEDGRGYDRCPDCTPPRGIPRVRAGTEVP